MSGSRSEHGTRTGTSSLPRGDFFGVADTAEDQETAIRWLIEYDAVLRLARNWADGRGFGAAIGHRLKPHLVRRTFNTCRADAIEGSRQLKAIKRHPGPLSKTRSLG